MTLTRHYCKTDRTPVVWWGERTREPYRRAFTLVEMLTVIAIIGIVAAFAVPAIKNFGKNDVSVSASRQLLDDIGYARQLAMSQRATVYMVFVPTNFWGPTSPGLLFTSPSLTVTQRVDATNILDRQLTGYTYMAYGAVGDQPGNHQWHYLAPWQNLPQGAYIPPWKFSNPNGTNTPFAFNDPANSSVYFHIYPFATNNTFPFPTADSPAAGTFGVMLSYIAFNYLGQLADYSGDLLSSANTVEDSDYIGGGVDIPISQGSVIDAIDVNTRMLQPNPPAIVENPPGNTTNISYNVIHIDPLTGRATLEFHKLQ
jgi:prepilin-type N-terminal cleavage/methylation domain-containing protein